MTVWVGNDHGGLDMKTRILELLKEKGVESHDVGSNSLDIVRYPYFAAEVASAVAGGEADRGILICSTGLGMSIIANKFPGVRASVCATSYLAKMTRLHNDSNLLCLGGKTTGIAEAEEIVRVWLDTSYEGGRHDISLGLIRESEAILMSGELWRPQGPRK
jgi:ribose 5-phosphate isomerase B